MKTILLVDDDESIQLLYQEEFKEAGYKVVSVYNGSEALDMFTQTAPDLVILDIQMPGFDGHKSQFLANPDFLWSGDGHQADAVRQMIAEMENNKTSH